MMKQLRPGSRCRSIVLVSLFPLFTALVHASLLHAGELSKERSLVGTLHVIQGDDVPGLGVQADLVGIMDDDGNWTPLRLEPDKIASGVEITQLAGRRVRVTGTWSNGEENGSALMPDHVEDLGLLGDPTAGDEDLPITARPFASILCRFSDSNYTPHPVSYYEGLMGNGSPLTKPRNMDKYWREISYNLVTLQGSRVFGWYNLPHPFSYYSPPNEHLGELAADCTAAADADAYFPSYFGINLFFNGGTGNWGVRWPLTLDGQTKTYGLTWLESNSHKLNYVAHEMGHGFGVAHSQCGEWEKSGTCQVIDPVYGCIPVHELGAYKDLFHHWIPASRIYTPNSSSERAIRLERLALPVSTSGYLLVKIPLDGSTTHYYTVETRKFAGYDANNIPGEAVIIQDVDINRPDGQPAHTVIAGGGSCSSEGAMWRVGETFVDSAHNLSIAVLSEDATSFQVAIGPCSSGSGSTTTACPDSTTIDPVLIDPVLIDPGMTDAVTDDQLPE